MGKKLRVNRSELVTRDLIERSRLTCQAAKEILEKSRAVERESKVCFALCTKDLDLAWEHAVEGKG